MRFLAFTFLALIGTAGIARAQSPTGIQGSLPEDLYEQGRTLMSQSRYAEACPKFEASLKLDPTATGTMLNEARCLELTGKTASAWALYKEAAGVAHGQNKPDREELAKKGAAGIEAELSKVHILPAATPALEVHLDGVALVAGSLDTDLAVDPGPHTVEATAPGHVPFKTTVTIDPHGDRKTVTIPVLAVEPTKTAVNASGGEGQPVPPTKPTPTSGWSAQRTAGAVVAGAGVAGVVVGAIFGSQTLSKNSSAKAHCGGEPMQCDPEGVTLNQDAKSAATISTVAFIAGGAFVAGGAVLFLTGGRHADTTKNTGAVALELHPVAGAGTAGLGLGGTW